MKRCCSCKGQLSRDGFCRRRSCGLFMADADEIRMLTVRNYWNRFPLRDIRLSAHYLVAKRLEKLRCR